MSDRFKLGDMLSGAMSITTSAKRARSNPAPAAGARA
jgi:hypothetical protein